MIVDSLSRPLPMAAWISRSTVTLTRSRPWSRSSAQALRMWKERKIKNIY